MEPLTMPNKVGKTSSSLLASRRLLTLRSPLLSHNHIMLVMRPFLSKAKWVSPANTDKNTVFCDADGTLADTAVAVNANGKELAEMLAEGIDAEVLS